MNTLKREDEGQKLSLRNLYGMWWEGINRKSRESKRGKRGKKSVTLKGVSLRGINQSLILQSELLHKTWRIAEENSEISEQAENA